MSAEDFRKHVLESLADIGPFKPAPYYDPEMDALIFYARDVQSYASRQNDVLTLYLSMADDSLVGFKLLGVKELVLAEEGGKDG